MAPGPTTLPSTDRGDRFRRDEDEGAGSVSEVQIFLDKRNVVCLDTWAWSDKESSKAVVIQNRHQKDTAIFHPHWSNGTAGVRADRPLIDGAVHYWEIHVGERVFGTSLMFGICTESARLHTNEFISILGEDIHGWGLSHRGRIYHNGVSRHYCKPFTEYTPVVVGILVDQVRGEMSFFKDGVWLGVAFTGLDEVEDSLYPACSSTAAKTLMRVGKRLRSFADLQDRCRHVINTRLRYLWAAEGETRLDNVVEELPLPRRIKEFVSLAL